MDLTEMIRDGLVYPTNNIKALIVYLILGLLVGIIGVFTGLGGIMMMSSKQLGGSIVIGLIGVILILVLYFLILGYSLDIIKFGIKRSNDAPDLDFARQITDGIKYIIVSIVYMIIPTIILAVIFSIFRHWLAVLIGIILIVLFAFLLTMAVCRLAETDNLGYALDFKGAYNDLMEIGVGKVVLTIIVSALVGFAIIMIISFIVGIILGIINSTSLISIVIPILTSILDAWLVFYINRVTGLLYSTKSLQ